MCNRQHAVCNVQQPTCNMQSHSMQPTACNRRRKNMKGGRGHRQHRKMQHAHMSRRSRLDCWRALIELKARGVVREIGVRTPLSTCSILAHPSTLNILRMRMPNQVSNFEVSHLLHLIHETAAVPAVNQIEFHVYYRDMELVNFCEKASAKHISHM